VAPPGTAFGPADPDALAAARSHSPLAGKYENAVDEYAYEMLQARAAAASAAKEQKAAQEPAEAQPESAGRQKAPKGSSCREGMIEAMAKSAARSVGSQLGRQIVRGVLGGILGGRR